MHYNTGVTIKDMSLLSKYPALAKPLTPALLALILGLSFAVLMPPFSGPDERGHVVYIAALAEGHLPLVPVTNTADFATTKRNSRLCSISLLLPAMCCWDTILSVDYISRACSAWRRWS
jgi:hypothetical protein